MHSYSKKSVICVRGAHILLGILYVWGGGETGDPGKLVIRGNTYHCETGNACANTKICCSSSGYYVLR